MMLGGEIYKCRIGSQDVQALSDIASRLNIETSDTQFVLNQYEEQLQNIYNSLITSDHAGLLRLSVILSEGLQMLINANRNLTENECSFLKKIPEIFSEYVFIPSSKISDAHLLSHFKSPLWIRPVTREEENEITQLLVRDQFEAKHDEQYEELQETFLLPDNNETTEIELTDFLLDNNLEQGYSSHDSSEKTSNNISSFEAYQEETNEVTKPGVTDLIDDYLNSEDNEVLSSVLSPVSSSQSDLENENTVDVSDLLALTSSDSVDFHFEEKGEIVDVGSLTVLESNEEVTKQKTIQLPYNINTNSNLLISEEQRELVSLVCEELSDITTDELTEYQLKEDISDLKNYLINTAEQIENISNAVDLIGLEGLGNFCRYLSSNVHVLALKEEVLSEEFALLLTTWPLIILSYLENIAEEKVSDNLIKYIKNEVWENPIDAENILSLETLLKHPVFKDEEKMIRQNKATKEDMSLKLPLDVNPELLEALLQDLPVQTGEFSTAIQNLQIQKSTKYLEIAQRIAHTVKGAGNVVGVKGVANLTHQLEDILEIQTKANKIPSNKLLNVLIEAADCLETMSEALLGIVEPPDNSVTIYQLVLDWANRLDKEGATDFNLDVDADTDEIQFVSSSSASDGLTSLNDEVKKPISIENMLRIPARLADDLLRLAGENLISTSQIQEYIKIIKGRYKSLKSHNHILQKLSFDLEHIVDVQGVANHLGDHTVVDDFDPLELDQYHELHSMSRRLIEIAADSIELAQVLEKDFTQLNSLVINQAQLQKENEELVLKTRMVSTQTIIGRLKRGVKQVCRLTNKQVDLEVIDNNTYMDSEVLNSLVEPLMHLLRNSVDHGIESVERRETLNKSSRGHIKLEFNRIGDQIMIDIEDDGKGLSLGEVREKAIELGLVNSEKEVTVENIQNMILRPGFSTRREVSQVSGRGIGLDVVHNKIRELKGTIDIRSEEGNGCRFSICLPVSSFSIHSILVRVRENIYALSNRGIEEIIYPGLGRLKNVDLELTFKLDNQVFNTILIERLLNLDEDRRDVDRSNRPVILVKDDAGITSAVLVQEVIDSRDVVVKSMGPYIPKIEGIIGATVLGDGSIATVVDLPELKQSFEISSNKDVQNIIYTDPQLKVKLPYILVVDDSLSARKSLAQFVEDLGIEVRTARDGMEAISLIDKRKPDLVLVDMEMPRMNGLELTTHIRANTITHDMPIIMITSRSTDKHRKVALDKGVSHYMVKPFSENELASHINMSLKIA